MRNKAPSIIVGLTAIGIGVAYILAAFYGIENFTIFVPGWWTIFIILPGLIMLFSRGTNKFFSLCLIILGVLLFLRRNNLLGDIRKYIIPGLIIVFGLSIIFGSLFNGERKKNAAFIATTFPEDGSIPAFEASFSEIHPDYSDKEFEGCSMDITFGSGELDLRHAVISHDVSISVNAAFSGVTIKLPPGCRVDLQTSTSFGGVTNKYISSETADAVVVHILAAVSFGGVDIK